MKHFVLTAALCLSCALGVIPSQAATPTQKLVMPDTMAMTFDGLFKSAKDTTIPGAGYLAELINFCDANTKAGLLPERPDKGAGVYMVADLPMPLQDILAYMLNPDVPGAALYPNSVRRAAWGKNDALRKDWTKLTQALAQAAPQDPAGDPPATFGLEYEETTPDETSGSYYGYTLNRTFVLTKDKQGRPTLVSLAVQTGPSAIGLKGAVVGPDKAWNYVYTGKPGSTLPMVGWAETYVYDSATLTIWTDTGSGTHLSVMKWLKAGWSGMNVVKPEHISRGVERYLEGLRQVMESPRRPTPETIAARYKALLAMNDEALGKELQAWATALIAAAKAQSIDSGDFADAFADGYVPVLSRDERIAELMKLFMKQQLGLAENPS